jgi:hypothetical protein
MIFFLFAVERTAKRNSSAVLPPKTSWKRLFFAFHPLNEKKKTN